ncbi:MAG: pyrroloquinoline-quinone synthase PqqC [Gammaproteobacteria bacterium]
MSIETAGGKAATAWTREEFEAQLRSLGNRYHINHPFQVMMNDGELEPSAIRGWVANRFYYQISIPLKDAALMANCPDREVRRQWIQRILDHDGREGDEGGIELWIRLGQACGLDREEIVSQSRVLPGVRFAVDAYVNFVRRAEWHEAVCSSLTELFAPTIHRQRIAAWPDRYPWIEADGLAYFKNRLGEAHRDVEHGLAVTLAHFVTRPQQERALEILQFKLDVLWTMLDAMYMAYVLNRPPYFNVDGPAVIAAGAPRAAAG